MFIHRIKMYFNEFITLFSYKNCFLNGSQTILMQHAIDFDFPISVERDKLQQQYEEESFGIYLEFYEDRVEVDY